MKLPSVHPIGVFMIASTTGLGTWFLVPEKVISSSNIKGTEQTIKLNSKEWHKLEEKIRIKALNNIFDNVEYRNKMKNWMDAECKEISKTHAYKENYRCDINWNVKNFDSHINHLKSELEKKLNAENNFFLEEVVGKEDRWDVGKSIQKTIDEMDIKITGLIV